MKINKNIDITNIKLDKFETYQEMSAMVDGDKIWFRFPQYLDLEPRAELFMAPAMIESMVRGVPIRIVGDIAISYRLAQSFREIQSLLKSWNNDFTVSSLSTNTRKSFPSTDFVIACNSGGIDSTYTYGRFREEITHILVMQGFDDWKESKGWEQNLANRKVFAETEGKQLVVVETNIRHYCEKRQYDYQLLFGSVLATVGITLNPKLFLIPSSLPYNHLHPSGSHPLLDPLWRTENTEIIHHDCAATRCDKTQYIAHYQELLDQIQVCWNSSSSNCGKCSKCLRTSIALRILGKKSIRLPEPDESTCYDIMTIKEENSLSYIEELIELSNDWKQDEVQKKLEKLVRAYQFKMVFHNFFKRILGKVGQKASRRLSTNPWYTLRATLVSNRVNKI